jgi:SET domain-containing protein
MQLESKTFFKTKVKKSKIDGKGLFAEENIPKGKKVLVKGGRIVSQKFVDNNQKIVKNSELQIDDTHCIAPTNNGEFKKSMLYINHSCEPNIGMQGKNIFVALRNISEGEEITTDYGTFQNDKFKMVCRCGEKKCRKIITGKDWQKTFLQKKYGNYFAPYLLQKIKK